MQTTEQAEDHPHGDTTGALPSIFVVGFPKAGTTTLHRLLVDAGARSATVKEPSVLLVDDAHGADLVAAYERYYPGASGRRHGPAIDASPYYVYDARAIDRLCALGSATHVLVCVREPWSRLVSQFKDQALQGFERRSLLGALVDELRVPVPVLDAAPRSISRSYLATTTYLPHLDRLLDSPLGPTVRLVAAESLDDEETRAALRRHTGLPVGAETVHANRARAGASLAPMLVDRVSAGVGSVVPAWLHRRVAPVAKPVLARAARLPIPGRMPAPVEVPAAIRDAAMARLAPTVEGLAALDADRWLGPRPDWVVRSG